MKSWHFVLFQFFQVITNVSTFSCNKISLEKFVRPETGTVAEAKGSISKEATFNNNDEDNSRTSGPFVEIVIVESPTLILIKVSLNNTNWTLYWYVYINFLPIWTPQMVFFMLPLYVSSRVRRKIENVCTFLWWSQACQFAFPLTIFIKLIFFGENLVLNKHFSW